MTIEYKFLVFTGVILVKNIILAKSCCYFNKYPLKIYIYNNLKDILSPYFFCDSIQIAISVNCSILG